MDLNPSRTAYKIAEGELARLAAALKSGHSERFIDYLAAMARFRTYAWTNVLLIHAQRPQASQVAGHHTWNDQGREVKPEEPGILVFAPSAEPQGYPFYTRRVPVSYVFDVTQTRGEPVLEPVRRSGSDETLALTARELARNVLNHAQGSTTTSVISEARAEASAYVALRGMGIDSSVDETQAAALNGVDKRSLAASLSAIDQTSRTVTEMLAPAWITSPEEINPILSREGFATAFRESRERLVHRLAKFTHDRDRAEDIASRAFQIAWEKRDGFRGGSSLTTWIEAIARNEARHVLRHLHSSPAVVSDDLAILSLPEPVHFIQRLERSEERAALLNALAEVPDKARRALTSHLVEGRSVQEIAHRERVPLGTVLSRIFTGKQALREAWNRAVLSSGDEQLVKSDRTRGAADPDIPFSR